MKYFSKKEEVNGEWYTEAKVGSHRSEGRDAALRRSRAVQARNRRAPGRGVFRR